MCNILQITLIMANGIRKNNRVLATKTFIVQLLEDIFQRGKAASLLQSGLNFLCKVLTSYKCLGEVKESEEEPDLTHFCIALSGTLAVCIDYRNKIWGWDCSE